MDGFGENELKVRQDDGERNSWKASARAGIEYQPRALEVFPGQDGIEHMLDCGVSRGRDARQVHVFVDCRDGTKVLPGFFNEAGAIGNIVRQNLR